MHRRPPGRGDQGNALGQQRQLLLVVLGEQPLILQFPLQLLKGGLPAAGPGEFDRIDHQLIVAPGLIDRNPSPADELRAIGDLLRQIAALGLEQHRLDLGLTVLEGKIEVAGVGPLQVRDLAADRHEGKAVLQEGLDGAGDLGDGLDS